MAGSALHALIVSRIRARGPITAAEFMELALYDPAHGYYATASRRSGRAGDFFTSVDVGPLFGQMVAQQLAEMWEVLRSAGARHMELVEAGAGIGTLAADILAASSNAHPGLHSSLRVTLVERSRAARQVLQDRFDTLDGRVTVAEHVPRNITGVILANELLDALPVHVVVMTDQGLREVYVAECDGRLAETLGPLSDLAIARHVESVGIELEPGCRVEVGLASHAWIRDAAIALTRGFLLLFDYGHLAAELYSPTHSQGTLTAYSRHTAGAVHWLDTPGECDLTAHVDLTSVRRAAESAGLLTLGAVDQTYFLTSLGIAAQLEEGSGVDAVRHRLAAKTLLMPGGLGSTIKVLAFGKGAGRPSLRGLTSGRLT